MTAANPSIPDTTATPARYIRKIVLSNFKKFAKFELALDPDLNVFVGDNEAGKSTVLLAVDLTLSGSFSKVETLGVEALLNRAAVERFLAGAKSVTDLPELFAEIYLSDVPGWESHGRVNSLHENTHGLRLVCRPSEMYAEEIAQTLLEESENFPFEFYTVEFQTFAGQPYGARRPLGHLLIDSATINSEHAHREYTKRLYQAHSTPAERGSHQNRYRGAKREFWGQHLEDLNARVPVKFWIRSSSRASLENDLQIVDDGIPVENKGRGQQSLIKTRFALQRGRGKQGIDVLMLEEPENHLSHGSMHAMVDEILQAGDKQVLVATHSSVICSRLDLRKTILMGRDGVAHTRLRELDKTTAAFFCKAPDHHLLEFALSARVILVEGDAEYILTAALYASATQSALARDRVHVIAVGGTSFKRYLELARLLKVRTAIVRDNDGDYVRHCVDNYAGLLSEHTKVFADTDSTRSTFEICLYRDNQALCETLFGAARRTQSVQDYMLNNKAEAAMTLLEHGARLEQPPYLKDAMAWIAQ